MLLRSFLDRLIGWPQITVRYRAHYPVFQSAHQLILKLIEDNEDGDTRRGSLVDWLRAERPVIVAHRGTTSLFRIDGPRQHIGREVFALGALIESPGVTAHLDPIATLHLEERVREAIEREILHWIAEHDLQSLRPVEARVNREIADPLAIKRMMAWVGRDRWIEEQSYVH
jgi:hypothetical protein